jgi:hypothetical protein
LHDARGGQVKEADAIGDLLVLLFNRLGAEQAEVSLELPQLFASHSVVGTIFGAASHSEAIIAFRFSFAIGVLMDAVEFSIAG